MKQPPRSEIGGKTRVIAILGDPVEHSRSPAMHNAAFAALALDYVYVALRVRPEELRTAIAGVRALSFAGLNVTVPHKEAVIPLLDNLTPAARAIGAVNTVVRRDDRLEGHNTDAEGFIRALRKLGFRPRGKHCVLLGAGGSARAVAWALADAGIGTLTIFNRNVDRATELARSVAANARIPVEGRPLAAAQDKEAVASADLVVNCTSLGLDGKTLPSVNFAAAPPRCLFYDLVYGGRATPFVRAAKRHARRGSTGLDMLLEQAALAFQLWTRRRAPLTVMARALRESTAG